MIPCYQSLLLLMSIVAGLIVLQEFELYSVWQLVLIALGALTIMTGIVVMGIDSCGRLTDKNSPVATLDSETDGEWKLEN